MHSLPGWQAAAVCDRASNLSQAEECLSDGGWLVRNHLHTHKINATAAFTTSRFRAVNVTWGCQAEWPHSVDQPRWLIVRPAYLYSNLASHGVFKSAMLPDKTSLPMIIIAALCSVPDDACTVTLLIMRLLHRARDATARLLMHLILEIRTVCMISESLTVSRQKRIYRMTTGMPWSSVQE